MSVVSSILMRAQQRKSLLAWIFLLNFSFSSTIDAADRIVNLAVNNKIVSFAGKVTTALAINNEIPAPTLHFNEGDHVTINVYNHLDQETSIHWHGLILPWQMDGVMGITQQGIPPGGVFHYQFTVHQAGTFWYHAHAGLQEQQGLYGAFIIDPTQKPLYHYNKDYVVVLSDWSNTDPQQILANLKKAGDYYAPRFPLQSSLVKFIHDYRKASSAERNNLIDDYKMMQQMRMGLYDFSDVAYDAFLLNGQPQTSPWTAPVKIGDVVRLRFIGAGGSTIFNVKIPGTKMQMVHVQGNDVKPHYVDDFSIAPGETVDVLVKIQKNDPSIIYAESIDTLSAAYGALVTSPNQSVNYKQVAPFPEPAPVTRPMMAMMMGKMHQDSLPMNATSTKMNKNAATARSSLNHEMATNRGGIQTSDQHSMNKSAMKPGMNLNTHGHMNHAMNMSMPTESTIIGDSLSPSSSTYQTSIGTKYERLTAAVKTNNPNKPVTAVINMELFGYMQRYIWFINGVPEYNAKPIIFKPGQRYRFVFSNTSMMRHPMHIHGHWFILRKGNGAYDPLLHTIDVAPGATITADVDTDASGQWLFHCHLLYHMMTGMARVFQYSTLLEITQGEAKPQNYLKQTSYINRPIVRVDRLKPIDAVQVAHPMAHIMGLHYATLLDIGEDALHHVQKVNFKGLYGSDYNKLELFSNDAQIKEGKIESADLDIFYWQLLDQFWSIKGGPNFVYRPAKKPYWQPGLGVEGLMPYFIETNIRGYYHKGSAKLDVELSRDTQITNNFLVRTEIRSILASKTVSEDTVGCGLNQMRYILRPYYRLMPGLNVFAEYEFEQDYGAFKALQSSAAESSTQNTLTLGLTMIL
jgi:CopA family copper-resistance protein